MIKCLLHTLLVVMCFSTYARQQGSHIVVLGTAQDGGYPHMGCSKKCCTDAWQHPGKKRYVASLALVDPTTKKWWLLEATPDIKEQLHYFQTLTHGAYPYLPEGIFITHAHIGHYTGLMQLGREVMSTKDLPVYVLPKMKTYLETNGPWSQLVALHNIALHQMQEGTALTVALGITITARSVPHRDEFSETAGFSIITPAKKYLFIPDINKWDMWHYNITDEVKAADIALLDATFYDNTELPGRSMKEVPHPLVTETMELFKNETAETKAHIHFIHLNHTNPLLRDSQKQKEIKAAGFNIAQQGEEL